MTNDIPQWAKERACELANVEKTAFGNSDWSPEEVHRFDSVTAFARYIADHEEPPVDPLLIEAREIAGDAMARFTHAGQQFSTGAINAVRTGNDDDTLQVAIALTALRRGIELGRASK